MTFHIPDINNYPLTDRVNTGNESCQSILEWAGQNVPDKPLLSIVIPTYKRPEMLRDILTKFSQQICDTDYEIVVVDNDSESTTSTLQVIQELNIYNLRYFRNSENIGVFNNWNRCVKLSAGKWFSLFQDDSYPGSTNFIAEFSKLLNCRPEINAISTKLVNVFTKDAYVSPLNNYYDSLCNFYQKVLFSKNASYDITFNQAWNLNAGNLINLTCSGVFFQKDKFIQTGGWDQNSYADFIPLMFYIKMFESITYIRKIETHMLAHGGNDGTSQVKTAQIVVSRSYMFDWMQQQQESPFKKKYLRILRDLYSSVTINHCFSEEVKSDLLNAISPITRHVYHKIPSFASRTITDFLTDIFVAIHSKHRY